MTDSAQTRWGAVLLCVLAGMAVAVQVGKVPPAMPAMRAELDLGLVAAGWIASSVAAIGAGLGIASGMLADRIGRRRLVLFGLAAAGIGSLGGALSPSGALLLLTRLLEGLGFVAVVVSAPSLIAEAARPADHRFALGLWATYMPAGMALIMLVSPLALLALGWRGVWLGIGLLILLFLAAFAWLVPAPARDAPRRLSTMRDILLALQRPGPWLLGGCFACYTLQWVAVMTWLPTFMIEEGGIPLSLAAPMTALMVLFNVPGNIMGGWLLQRGVARASLIATALVTMAVMALGMFGSGLPVGLRYGMGIVFSMVGGMLPAACLSGAPFHARTQSEIGAVNGVIVQGSNLGSFSGPPALAFMVATFGGWGAVRPYLVGAALAGILCAIALHRLERRR
ncbi:MAG: MFS transporter [Alphaproteobacteria bacterium]|nr:MFS transporter [Alphaproteobacteria bacterium]